MAMGTNSWITAYPQLYAEWDYSKNRELSPEQVSCGSARKVWWRCSHGHSFSRSLQSRIRGKTAPDFVSCPHCSHKIATPGEYSLKTEFPELMDEWDFAKNEKEGIDPDTLLPGSNKKAFWKCIHGHEWEARISHRTLNGTRCPYCSGKAVSEDNNLAVLFPGIAAEWDYEENESLLDGRTPEGFRPGSAVVAAWKCLKNPKHKYKEKISHRAEGFGCPYCSHHRIIPEDSFAAEFPELMKDWDWTKNEGVDPYALAPKAQQKVQWKCHRCGYEWEAVINDRARGRNCIKCQRGVGTSFGEQVFY